MSSGGSHPPPPLRRSSRVRKAPSSLESESQPPPSASSASASVSVLHDQPLAFPAFAKDDDEDTVAAVGDAGSAAAAAAAGAPATVKQEPTPKRRKLVKEEASADGEAPVAAAVASFQAATATPASRSPGVGVAAAAAAAAPLAAAASAAASPPPLRLLHLPTRARPNPRPNDDAAQDLIFDAWDTQSAAGRKALLARALALSPDLPDALSFEAQERWENNPAKALPLYERAVIVGADRLGSDYFDSYAGEFWPLLDPRPYLRALLMYAVTLWKLGREAEAVAYMRECLRLNTNDNQGVRMPLSSFLLTINDLAGAQALLDQYEKDCGDTALRFNRALLHFKRGEMEQATAAARVARAQNGHVIPFLLGAAVPAAVKKSPFMTRGDPCDAYQYTRDGLRAWTETPGGIAWLRTI